MAKLHCKGFVCNVPFVGPGQRAPRVKPGLKGKFSQARVPTRQPVQERLKGAGSARKVRFSSKR